MKRNDTNDRSFPLQSAAPAQPSEIDTSPVDSTEPRYERLLDDEHLRAIHARALGEALRRANGQQ